MRLTKKFKIENYETLQRERDALAEYTWHIANRKDWDAFATIEGDHDAHEVTTLAVYGLNRASGGIIVISHYYDGQSTSCTVEYFDAWCEKIRALGYATDHTSALQSARLDLISQGRRVREHVEAWRGPVVCRACRKTLAECNAAPECSETNNYEHDIPGHRLHTTLTRAQ